MREIKKCSIFVVKEYNVKVSKHYHILVSAISLHVSKKRYFCNNGAQDLVLWGHLNNT
jgi:hypothetical protein